MMMMMMMMMMSRLTFLARGSRNAHRLPRSISPRKRRFQRWRESSLSSCGDTAVSLTAIRDTELRAYVGRLHSRTI